VELTEKEMAYIEAQINFTESKIQDAQDALDAAQAELDRRTGLLNGRLRALYEVGPAGYLEVLLAATSFSDFLSRFDLLSAIVSHDVKLMHSIGETKDEYTQIREELEQQLDQLTNLKQLEEAKRAQLASRTADRTRYLAQVQNDLAEYEKALDDLERTTQELTKIIQDLQAKSSVSRTGEFSPVWPVTGRITSPFGTRLHPVTRTYRHHSGIDIAVSTGTPVKAADAGVVLLSDWHGGYGKTVIIDHGGGISTLYAHNSNLLVKVGQTVTRGQVVAHAGSTGVSTGPHVHFEVRVNGTPVDPMNYLK